MQGPFYNIVKQKKTFFGLTQEIWIQGFKHLNIGTAYNQTTRCSELWTKVQIIPHKCISTASVTLWPSSWKIFVSGQLLSSIANLYICQLQNCNSFSILFWKSVPYDNKCNIMKPISGFSDPQFLERNGTWENIYLKT